MAKNSGNIQQELDSLRSERNITVEKVKSYNRNISYDLLYGNMGKEIKDYIANNNLDKNDKKIKKMSLFKRILFFIFKLF